MSFLVEYSEVPIGSNTDYVRQWCHFRHQPEFLHQMLDRKPELIGTLSFYFCMPYNLLS